MNDKSGRRKDVYPMGKKNPNLPFHPAVRAGDFMFVSGQVAKTPTAT
jgi:2-iminobutanoate/2-iminopropanoate deaminase